MNTLSETSRPITLNFIHESMYMRLASLFFFFLYSFVLSANPITPDSLLKLLQKNEIDNVIGQLTISKKNGQKINDPSSTIVLEKEVILMLAYAMQGDSSTSLILREEILNKKLSTVHAQDLILFVYLSGYKFVTNPHVFFLIQQFGIDLSVKYNEPRAHFSFLQQKFTMLQMTSQVSNLPNILLDMRALSISSEYLTYQTDMHYSLYFCTIQNDSCTYYFEKYMAASSHWLGKPNPYFLNAEGYSLKKDSSIMAGVITEYAKYYSHQGDLKQAGEWLIRSLQVIPDTPTMVLLQVRNQLALANIYADLVNPFRALLYLEKAIDLCETNKLSRLRNTLVASSYAYALMADGQFEKAAVELRTAYYEYPRNLNCQDPKKEAMRLALNASFLNEFKLCESMLDTASQIDCRSSVDIQFYQAMAQGRLAAYKGSFVQAQSNLERASQHAKSTKSMGWIKDVLYQKYLCFKHFGKTQESIDALESYTYLKDSLYRSGQDVALFDIEAAYQKSIQDETIARLDAENEASMVMLSAQKRSLMIASLALVALLIFLFLVWRLYKKVKITNAQLSKVVAEKNILLREIHHRVKNNLQVISSLLKLQSGYIKDDAAIQAIAEGRSRVQSMALLHQNLYKEDNLKGVDMQEYFDNLIQGLFDTYNISPERIQLHKNIEAISLDVDTVVPLGLITNELISNALKHAFPDNIAGNLYIALFEQSGNLILKVRDDGNGMTTQSTKEGFGSKLIQSLSQKLEADITTRSMQGTEITLTIREYRKAA